MKNLKLTPAIGESHVELSFESERSTNTVKQPEPVREKQLDEVVKPKF